MDNGTWFLLVLLLVGVICVILWKQKREISDGVAMWWATVSEPLAYVMDDPEDFGVTARAANARAKLALHGNKLLSPNSDVWEYVYRADPMTPTMDFALWRDTTLLHIKQRTEQWRKQKAEWNLAEAKSHFAGQSVYTHHDN